MVCFLQRKVAKNCFIEHVPSFHGNFTFGYDAGFPAIRVVRLPILLNG